MYLKTVKKDLDTGQPAVFLGTINGQESISVVQLQSLPLRTLWAASLNTVCCRDSYCFFVSIHHLNGLRSGLRLMALGCHNPLFLSYVNIGFHWSFLIRRGDENPQHDGTAATSFSSSDDSSNSSDLAHDLVQSNTRKRRTKSGNTVNLVISVIFLINVYAIRCVLNRTI